MCMAPSMPSPPPAPEMPTPPPPPPPPPPAPVAVGEKMSTIKTAANTRNVRKRAAGVANFKAPGQSPASTQPLSAEKAPNLGTIRSRAVGLNIPGS